MFKQIKEREINLVGVSKMGDTVLLLNGTKNPSKYTLIMYLQTKFKTWTAMLSNRICNYTDTNSIINEE